MTLNRLGLYFSFRPENSAFFHKDLGAAFWMGFRFDLSLISYFATLSVLLTFFLQSLRNFKKLLLGYWFGVLSILGTLFAIDYGFYSYFQDHLNLMFFGFFTDDTWALIKTFWNNYPFVRIILIYLALLLLLWWALDRMIQKFFVQQPASKHHLALCFTGFLCFGLAARGTVRIFPLNVQDSIVSEDSFINFLTFNAGHSFVKATKLFIAQDKAWNQNAQLFHYSSETEAVRDYLLSSGWELPPQSEFRVQDLVRKTPPQVPLEKAHVVVIIMESFGSYWIRFSDETNFDLLGNLKIHFKEDSLFLNSLPNSGSTIGTLSSFLIGFPQRQLGAFLTETELLNARFPSAIASPFLRSGYQTRFIYGGSPAWRDIGKFASHQGFQQVDGQVEIENRLFPLRGRPLEKHDWGLFDEDVFEYARTLLSEAISPQMILIMTTTNHPPYLLPENSILSFSKRPLEIPQALKTQLTVDPTLAQKRFEAYRYSNEALANFLSQVKSDPTLQSRTVLGVTGDHSFWIVNFDETHVIDKWGVPLYLHIPPQAKVKLDRSRFVSQMDLMPTIFSLVLPNVSYLSPGQVLSNPRLPEGSLWFGGYLVSKQGAAQALGSRETRFYQWNQNQLSPSTATPELETAAVRYRSLMSIMDYYFKAWRQIDLGSF